MERFRLTILVESRIRWKVYVRFGGEYWETYHRNMTRRRVLSLHKLTVDGQIADQSRPGQPLEFIFGTGMLLPKFEEAILGKEIGESVSFTLEAKDGYGEVIADAIVDLPKDIFMVDGKLAEDILFEGSQVPMSDAQGNRMMGIVKEVGESTVKMDFNHPMAGKTLNFDVEVVSVRDVTPEDLQGGCSCGECGGDCGEGCGDHDGHCNCH